MPLRFAEDLAVLTGTVSVEEAEPLAAWLRAAADPAGLAVDLAGCEHLHTAALQLLLVAGVKVAAAPADPFLRSWVLPLLRPAPADPAPRTAPPEEVPA